MRGESNSGDTPFVYLDHSATTPVDQRVAEVVYRTMLDGWGNPSSRYHKAGEAKLILETAREQVAGVMNAEPKDVFFTSGGTEADNLALKGVMRLAAREGRGRHLVVSAVEHSAVLKAAKALEEEGFRLTVLPVNGEGFVEVDALASAIEKDTVLVSVMHVNNEIGSIQPIERLGGLCRERGVLFHTDAVQSYGKVPLDVRAMPLDLVSVSSHKIYGPKGVGALYVRPGVELLPVQHGGGQEKGVRTGTENTPGIAGFGAAAEICGREMADEAARLSGWRDRFLGWVREAVEGEVIVNGSLERRLPGNLNLRFPGVEGESLMLALDLDGIAVSTGSACSSASTEPSHVLLALGLSEAEAHSSIRFTLGRSNDEQGLKYAAERVAYHVNRLRAMAW